MRGEALVELFDQSLRYSVRRRPPDLCRVVFKTQRCTLLLVPVLVREVPHAVGRRIHRRLIGALSSGGGIHKRITLNTAAVACVVVVVIVVIAVAVFPHSWGRRRVAGHGITGLRTVLERNIPKRKLSVLVELLELGATVLEPNFDLKKQTSYDEITSSR